jgi:transitional endoplasmic reticulum ATPase
MNFYKLDYTIEKVLNEAQTREQKILRELTGENFDKEESKIVLAKILDHKWYVGEKLSRDIGLRVAAIDYLENFYEPTVEGNNKNNRRFEQSVLSPMTFAA